MKDLLHSNFRKVNSSIFMLFGVLPFCIGFSLTIYSIYLEIQVNVSKSAPLINYGGVLVSIIGIFVLVYIVSIVTKNGSNLSGLFPIFVLSGLGADRVIKSLVSPQNPEIAWIIGFIFVLLLVVTYFSLSKDNNAALEAEVKP